MVVVGMKVLLLVLWVGLRAMIGTARSGMLARRWAVLIRKIDACGDDQITAPANPEDVAPVFGPKALHRQCSSDSFKDSIDHN